MVGRPAFKHVAIAFMWSTVPANAQSLTNPFTVTSGSQYCELSNGGLCVGTGSGDCTYLPLRLSS